MTREKYLHIRTKALRIFGIVMLTLGLFIAVFAPLHTKAVHKHSTAVTVGKVVGEKFVTNDDGKKVRKVQISYTLPDDHWLVLYESALPVGAEVSVYYNPNNTEEKYIEGFEDSPVGELLTGLLGAAMGAGAIIVSCLSKKHPEVNNVIDMVDNRIR